MTNAYSIVDQFEKRVAEFAGSRYAVAVDSGTNAIKLSFACMLTGKDTRVDLPSKTYVSVPMCIIQLGLKIKFIPHIWRGKYSMWGCFNGEERNVIDSAKRFRKGMYDGEDFYCLSFHVKKHINIGRGGMILCDEEKYYDELRCLRYDGRTQSPYGTKPINYMGYNAYMTPEQAARGLMLMDIMPKDGFDDLIEDYPDLTDEKLFPVFKDHPQVVR